MSAARSTPPTAPPPAEAHVSRVSDRRFTDTASNRVVNNPAPATVRIQEPARTNGVNAAEVSEALASGGKGKKKAYRRYKDEFDGVKILNLSMFRSDSTNSVGGARSRGHTKELALPPDDSLMCPPSFLTGLKPELQIKDGSRLELKVQVKGDPDPQVSWLKDGKPISSNEIMEVKYKNGAASVTINEVFPEDGGRFTCKATNTKGSVETSSKVTVLPMDKKGVNGATNGSSAGPSPPKIISHIQSATVKDGDPVTLSCTIGGAERFDVVWLHNEKEIKPSKDFEYKAAGSVYSLNITEIFPEDAGTYTCEAFNDLGECFSSCSLVVSVPGETRLAPDFVRFPASLSVARGAAASFEAELNSPASSVSWMKVNKQSNIFFSKIKYFFHS